MSPSPAGTTPVMSVVSNRSGFSPVVNQVTCLAGPPTLSRSMILTTRISSENVGQDAILSHVFSSFFGEFCVLVNDSSEYAGQDAILSHVFSSFFGEFCVLVNDSPVIVLIWVHSTSSEKQIGLRTTAAAIWQEWYTWLQCATSTGSAKNTETS